MFIIRAIWHQLTGKRRVIVLPCGSFFKDYYVAGIRRRIAGGREAVDDLRSYLKESHRGLLVLHHVERLPTALQEELAARLASSMAGPELARRLSGVDHEGLQEYDVMIVATSTFSPELLQQTAIENALEQTGGNVAAAARLLGRDEKGLYRTMVRLGMGRRGKRAGR